MFCAFFAPDFRLQAALRYRPRLWEQPVGIVVEESVLVELTEPALAAGVWVGMSPSQGLARCLELEVLPRAHEQEQVLGETLLGLASSVAAFVEQTKREACIVNLQGSRAFHQDMERDPEERDPERIREWGMALVAQAARAGVTVRLGIAANPDLALLAAQSTTAANPVRYVTPSCGFMARLPLDVLEPPEHLAAVLHGWGIATLGALAKLRRDDVVKRLGPESGLLWDKAAGRATRLLRLERPPESYEERHDFEYELENSQPLLFLLRRFLEQLVARLEAVGRVVGAMRLVLPLSDGGSYERHFSIPSPTADVEALFRVLDTHLESLQLEVGPVGVRLNVEPVEPEHQQFRFFEEAMRDPNRFAGTLARLLAIVGEGRVGVPERLPTHRPDAWRLSMPDFAAAGAKHQRRSQKQRRKQKQAQEQEAPGQHGVGVPLRRFRPAVIAQVEREREEQGQPAAAGAKSPKGAPRRIISREVEGRVARVLGPYCLSGEWWEGEAGWSVEEWDVAMEGGGLYRLSCSATGEWVVEGCYEQKPIVFKK